MLMPKDVAVEFFDCQFLLNAHYVGQIKMQYDRNARCGPLQDRVQCNYEQPDLKQLCNC